MGEQIEFTDDGLREIIHSYTREAGVRNLEREIATQIRKQARRIAEGKTEKLIVTPEVVHGSLGVPKYRAERKSRNALKDSRRVRRLVWGRHPAAISFSSKRAVCVVGNSSCNDRAFGRSDAGVDDGSAGRGYAPTPNATTSIPTFSGSRTSTSTCRPAQCRKTDLRRAWQWSTRW